MLWALRDRIAQRAVYDILAPIFEPTFLPCSFGFRSGLGVEQAVQQVLAYRDQNLRWVVDGDIRNCFDAIPTDRLLALVKRKVRSRLLLRYIRSWLDADLMDSLDGAPRRAGVSQGSVLSPLFANIYLHEWDVALTGKELALVRYADDFVICTQRRRDAESALRLATGSLAHLDLAIHPHKTRIVHIDEGFRWLGHFFIRNECYRL